MNKGNHVIVGISGGVDSAVAACLLIEEGFTVTGLNIKVLDNTEENPNLSPSPMVISDLEDFRFPVYTLNLSDSFHNDVISYFIHDYLGGRTPNPCMVCNKLIKWKGLFKGAELLRADSVATGHYARIECNDGSCRLFKGSDNQKDQSYFLWMLETGDISRTLFPLGNLTKTEVRKHARRFRVKAAEKKESQEICFVPGNDYRQYLASSLPGIEERLKGGDIVDPSGSVIGYHAGYPFYTIGQRKGLGVSSPKPLYVNRLDPDTNRVHVGGKELLQCRKLKAGSMNWIGIDRPETPLLCAARIRYRDKEEPCRIVPLGKGTVEVLFDKPKQSVTPGQAVVFYRNDEVIGGGIIQEALPDPT